MTGPAGLGQGKLVMRARMSRLLLGPVVGHTDDRSSRVWIRAADDPGLYRLQVFGAGTAPFLSTESAGIEFGTAVAHIEGLRADWQYRYRVLRRGRAVPGGQGSFRTLPAAGALADIQFIFISCNHQKEPGAWQQLQDHIKEFKPRFLLMMGDQVYVDQNGDVWQSHLDRPPAERRQALAQKYQDNWSRSPVKEILANIPTYMIWDDHEIRDGWGSWAPDSPTMVARYPRGSAIYARHDAYFRDARDVFWHFQMCHNPPVTPPLPAERKAMPFVFTCGRLLVLVLDSRGARDIWRPESPILGLEQWQLIDQLFADLPAEIDVLAIVTPTPIASMSPRSISQASADLMKHVPPDVRYFARGDAQRLANLINSGGTAVPGIGGEMTGLNPILRKTVFKIRAKIDEVRDQWSHHLSRPEQVALIRKAGAARKTNRTKQNPRQIIFLAGDIHMGGIFDLTIKDPAYTAASLVSSGISQAADKAIDSMVTVDESFEVAPGIHCRQRELVQDYNFGVVQIISTGGKAEVIPAIVHSGQSASSVLQIRR